MAVITSNLEKNSLNFPSIGYLQSDIAKAFLSFVHDSVGERSSLRCEIQLAVSIVTGTNYGLEMTNWKDNQNYCQIFVPSSPLSHSSEHIAVRTKQMKEKVLHLHPSRKKRSTFNKPNPLQTEIYTFHFTKLEGRIHKNFIEKVYL